MRCKTCDYPLWKITTRRCPECGTAFKPSDFEFVHNSVCFCCPKCDQAYYGTGASGHLVPSSFTCVKCGTPLTMDDMVLRPAAGVDERNAVPDAMPWLNRAHRGRWKSWIATIGKALFNPGALMKSVPENASTGQALWFLTLTTLAVSFATSLPWMLLMILPMAIGSGGPRGAGGALGAFAGISSFFVFLGLVGTLLGAMLWGLIAHGLLRISGPTSMTLGRTIQAICYSSGANVTSAVPCLGTYFGWIWWVVSAVFMIKEAQRVSGGRAALAALTLPIVFIGLVVAGYVALFMGMAYLGSVFRPPVPGGASTLSSGQELSAQAIVTALHDHVITFGDWPGHAIQIVTPTSQVRDDKFVLPYSRTKLQSVTVGGQMLSDLKFMSAEGRQQAVQKAIDALPKDVIAYRLGDFVFTYPRIDLGSDTSGLWMAVMCYDPQENAPPKSPGPIVLGFVDGTTIEITQKELSSLLYAQNERRAQNGLPPLPDPATLARDNPARGR